MYVTDATDEMHSSAANDDSDNVQAVYNACLIDSRSQSSCSVTVMRLDWESISDRQLISLAASVDCVIATGSSLIHTAEVHVSVV